MAYLAVTIIPFGIIIWNYLCNYSCECMFLSTVNHFIFLLPASIHCRVTIGPPAKRHSNRVSLVGQWCTTFRCCKALLYKITDNISAPRYVCSGLSLT